MFTFRLRHLLEILGGFQKEYIWSPPRVLSYSGTSTFLLTFKMEVVIKRELTEDALKSRLGTCEKCGAHEARYTCPRCEFRSCCLQCVNLHKKEFDCNGIRDKTRFKPVSQFTELDLLSGKRKKLPDLCLTDLFCYCRLSSIGRSRPIC